MNKKWSVIYFISTFCLSYGLGILFKDRYLMGSTTLFLGFVQTYFMSKGKWYEEFVGIFETIMSTIVCIFACMYGSAFFTILIHIPLSIFSIINWKKHENDNTVKLNKMTLTKSLITIFLVIICTAILSFLLSLIPTQRLAFWDAFGDVLDICGILLVALRYKEGLAIWIICNIVELVTWIISLTNGYSQNAIMMIIMSLIYVVLNVWAYISFIKIRKTQENKN